MGSILAVFVLLIETDGILARYLLSPNIIQFVMSEQIESQSGSAEEIIPFVNEIREGEEVGVAYPWYSERTRKLQDPILRMHNEAIDFYLHTQPTKQQHEANLQLLEKAKRIILMHCDALLLAPFLLRGLYLRGTEGELYLLAHQLTPEFAARIAELFSETMSVNVLPQTGQRYEIMELQVEHEGARLIIRMLERSKWEEYLGLMEETLSQITEFKFVYFIISCAIRQRWLHLAVRPSLLFALISVFYHERRKHKVRTLTENIIKFVQYYGVGPFQERRINYLGKNRYELIQEGPPPTPFAFWINDRTNIANAAVRELFGFLKNRYRLISNYNFDDEQSIIGLLVNPCKKLFSY